MEGEHAQKPILTSVILTPRAITGEYATTVVSQHVWRLTAFTSSIPTIDTSQPSKPLHQYSLPQQEITT